MSQAFDDLVSIVARLRAPDGCPWDQRQTHESLKPYLIEEAYEVIEALDRDDPNQLRQELGDLFLQILLHAEIEDELRNFSIEQVITALSQKLTRRHPHEFGSDRETEKTLNAEQVLNQWEIIKQTERSEEGKSNSMLDGVPASLPALLRAYQVQKRAARVGFDWNKPKQVIDKLDEELQELREATNHHETQKPLSSEKQRNDSLHAMEHEFGDVLFTIANVARFLNINPEEALRKSCNRFVRRFVNMEQQARAAGKDLQQLTPKEWDAFWEIAKTQEQLTAKLRSSL